jgi:hypothetical protein
VPHEKLEGSDAADPLDILVRLENIEQDQKRLALILESVSLQQRTLLMSYAQEATLADAARESCIPYNQAKQQMYRVRQKAIELLPDSTL